MNLDEMKTTWQAYDQRIAATHQLSERLVRSMMKDKSKGTLARMRQELRLVSVIFTAVIFFFSAVILGNAFDYTHWLEYIPTVLYMLLASTGLVLILGEYRQLRKVNLTKENLRESLRLVIRSHERFGAALGKVWKLCMGAGFLFGVSFVARTIPKYGWGKAFLFVGGQALLILLLYAVARWLFDAFQDPHTAQLKENLRELEEFDSN
ncbi:MAG: hypothetical protein H7Z75_03445 [Ferruginibacter sp.]|nr:hypothetical protein [Cytophagales bacterium]